MQHCISPIYIGNAVAEDSFLGPKRNDLSNSLCSLEAIGAGLEFALRKFQVYQFIWDLDLVGSRWRIQPLKLINHGFPGAVNRDDVLNYVTAMLEKDYETAKSMEKEGLVETLLAGTTIEVVERYQGNQFDLVKVKREEDLEEFWTVTASLSSPNLP